MLLKTNLFWSYHKTNYSHLFLALLYILLCPCGQKEKAMKIDAVRCKCRSKTEGLQSTQAKNNTISVSRVQKELSLIGRIFNKHLSAEQQTGRKPVYGTD